MTAYLYPAKVFALGFSCFVVVVFLFVCLFVVVVVVVFGVGLHEKHESHAH